MASATSTAPEAAREIVSSRVLPFPREQVFAAIADSSSLARWWGPAGFTNSFQQFEFRRGGEWKFVMHGPDGTDYPNHVVVEELQAPERIVLRHVPPHFTNTITWREEDGGTRIQFRMLFDDAGTRDALAPICVPANEQNFDRLHAELSARR
jgi:uncharacterized protein YndB with AHSA1/START domain